MVHVVHLLQNQMKGGTDSSNDTDSDTSLNYCDGSLRFMLFPPVPESYTMETCCSVFDKIRPCFIPTQERENVSFLNITIRKQSDSQIILTKHSEKTGYILP